MRSIVAGALAGLLLASCKPTTAARGEVLAREFLESRGVVTAFSCADGRGEDAPAQCVAIIDNAIVFLLLCDDDDGSCEIQTVATRALGEKPVLE